MNVELFNFDLPKQNIALRPAAPRDSAKMLVVAESNLDAVVGDLADFLRPGDALVFNDTRVIPARLHGKRGEAKMEITLHKRMTDSRWCVFAKPAKKCRLGDILDFSGLKARVEEIGDAGERTVNFDIGSRTIWEALAAHGTMPLPPYIATRRAPDSRDEHDYQTIF
ncbi:MAG: S-adenosylmethionine:tRNA ribosyltransferase-isomerase, partial [Kordiimonadaceae bacterium]|nr:S-adenosylmethionine:tRNA ribosyltransferase-isomerase [Kordiimonadaceae bacterium]